ncbi:MAG: PAS domain S-box protein [Calothrix sp. MO_167.B12]|nr:PAS domain S-box protein [Calothrix sp. MO_167.B12]
MIPSSWEHAIQAVHEQLDNLLERGREAAKHPETPQNYANLLTEALVQLSIALEELEVSAEELQEKNEELIATRQILQLERQRYQDLFDSAPDAYFVTNTEGVILDVNETTAEMLQVRPTYLLGKPLLVFIHEADRLKLNQIILQLQQQKQPLRCQELRLSRPQANIDIAVEVTAVAMCNDQGEVVSLRWLLRDIRERQQAEAKIRQQAALIDITTDAICLTDLQNQILFWNQGAERLYGWTAEEALGKKADELFDQESASQLEDGLKATIAEGNWQGELEQITKDNKEIIVASRWTLVRDAAGQPQSIMVVNTDITEKKQLQKQLFHAQRLESIGILASGIAHDLNNILTPIVTVPHLLSVKIPNLSESNQELLKLIETSGKRGANLVKQVLLFARGGNEGQHILLSVKELLNEIVKIVQSTFPKSITIKTDIPQGLWTIDGDPTQIHQLLMNLIVNAHDAMADEGTLSISAENFVIDETYARMHLDAKVGHYTKITIADTGMGIPREIIDRIYDPFFTTKEVSKGTGLGLSVVSGIIKDHGGFIDVSSKVGEGSQFKVYLPSTSALSAEVTDDDKSVLTGQGELILVVDDEAAICQAVKNTLENYNYKVITAKDGVEAMSLYALHYNKIRVILMDIMMPDMNGAIAIQAVRKINPQVKIIAMSGLVSPEDLKQLRTPGVQGFLYKPFTAIELRNAVHQTLSET